MFNEKESLPSQRRTCTLLEPKAVKIELEEYARQRRAEEKQGRLRVKNSFSEQGSQDSPTSSPTWKSGVPPDLLKELESGAGWSRNGEDNGFRVEMYGDHPDLEYLDSASRQRHMLQYCTLKFKVR